MSSTKTVVDGDKSMNDDYVSRREFEAVVAGFEKLVSQGFVHSQKMADMRSSTSDKAIEIAMKSMNERFDNTNEWRATLDKYVNSLANKEDVVRLEKAVIAIQLSDATLSGKANLGSVIGSYVFAAVMALLSFLAKTFIK